MNDLKQQLDETVQSIQQNVPAEMFATMTRETEQLKATGIEGRTVQNNEKAPDFSLTNHLGEEIHLESMLGNGPLVLSFYRGGW